MSGAVPLLLVSNFVVWTGTTLSFFIQNSLHYSWYSGHADTANRIFISRSCQ